MLRMGKEWIVRTWGYLCDRSGNSDAHGKGMNCHNMGLFMWLFWEWLCCAWERSELSQHGVIYVIVVGMVTLRMGKEWIITTWGYLCDRCGYGDVAHGKGVNCHNMGLCMWLFWEWLCCAWERSELSQHGVIYVIVVGMVTLRMGKEWIVTTWGYLCDRCENGDVAHGKGVNCHNMGLFMWSFHISASEMTLSISVLL